MGLWGLTKLDHVSKPGDRFAIIPPSGRDPGAAYDGLHQARALDCFLNVARKEPRMHTLLAYYWTHPVPSFVGSWEGIGLYGTGSAYRRKYEALGAAVKKKIFCQLDLGYGQPCSGPPWAGWRSIHEQHISGHIR